MVMYVSTRVLNALDAASKLSNVSHAAENAQAVIKAIENLKITDKNIILLASRAFDVVIAAYDLCKRITDSGDELNEIIRDDIRRLATLLGNIEQECKKISKKKLDLLITRRVTKFVGKMNKELDSMTFQGSTVSIIGMSRKISGTSTTSNESYSSGTSEESASSASEPRDHSSSSANTSTLPSGNTTGTPRINAQGRHFTAIHRSGCDTTTRTIYGNSGEATETSKARTRNASDSTRVLATGDNVIIADSGNDSEHTYLYQHGESPRQQTNDDQTSRVFQEAMQDMFANVSRSMGLSLQGSSQPLRASQPQQIAYQPSYPQQGTKQHIQSLLARA